LWIIYFIKHLGEDGLANLLEECVGVVTESTFGNKLSGRNYRKKHCHKPWFDANCRTTKHELRLWLKANFDSHVAKHQESKFKNLLKRKKNSKKLYELDICVRLPRWMRSCSGKSNSQRQLLWTRSVQLRFWKASVR